MNIVTHYCSLHTIRNNKTTKPGIHFVSFSYLSTLEPEWKLFPSCSESVSAFLNSKHLMALSDPVNCESSKSTSFDLVLMTFRDKVYFFIKEGMPLCTFRSQQDVLLPH
ncbi:hypothetical protein L596_024069 [Steinernema carpocapsae]|uniref:Uncharacterized protein n=1 Tax=Steinernema carpocapsae TaxID=34508 RepID=A0A4U5MFL7_STECR|nr:hypothetical protein L596_024069 [Steinernema carpocapsae]